VTRFALPLWPTLAALSAAALVVQAFGVHATAWPFFDDAAHLLVSWDIGHQRGGLHLYAEHPEFQFGPLAVVAALPFAVLGPTLGEAMAMAAAAAAGLLAFAWMLDTVERLRPGFRASTSNTVLLLGGAVVVLTWSDVAVRTAHIDDAIALVALTAAMRACAGNEGLPTGVALTIAAAVKPWAIMFAPLAFVPSGRRLARFVLIGAVVALTWLPFVLADFRTLDTADFTIGNDPTSVLRALGIDDPDTPPWARPAQIIGGTVVVAVVVASRRWPAALLAGVAWRLLLEPGANRYYTVGFVLGALLVEFLARPGRLPLWTLAAAIVLEATGSPEMPGTVGRYLRLACVIGALIAVSSRRARAPDSADLLGQS
jgi:hypothetical protein